MKFLILLSILVSSSSVFTQEMDDTYIKQIRAGRELDANSLEALNKIIICGKEFRDATSSGWTAISKVTIKRVGQDDSVLRTTIEFKNYMEQSKVVNPLVKSLTIVENQQDGRRCDIQLESEN